MIFGFLFGGIDAQADSSKSVYDFKAKLIQGTEKNISDYRGKVLLIVNTASQCGFTKQYAGLQSVYEKYQEQGLEVLAFPSNNFGGQEPGTNEEIKQFCDLRFKAKFPLFEKVDVKGKAAHPLFHYLTEESPQKGSIKWNFTKFLIARDGRVVDRFGSTDDPLSDKVTQAVEAQLAVQPS